MLHAVLWVCAPLASQAQELPLWFRTLQALPGLDSRFVQQSESAIFKAVTQAGRLQVARGGKLRVVYDKGSLMVCDGKLLVHYDPLARTAQRMDLHSVVKEAPVLAILLDPANLDTHYTPVRNGEKVVLQPKRKGVPEVTLTGQGTLLSTVSWVDQTGARQVLTLKNPEIRRQFPQDTFTARLPENTRWIK